MLINGYDSESYRYLLYVSSWSSNNSLRNNVSHQGCWAAWRESGVWNATEETASCSLVSYPSPISVGDMKWPHIYCRSVGRPCVLVLTTNVSIATLLPPYGCNLTSSFTDNAALVTFLLLAHHAPMILSFVFAMAQWLHLSGYGFIHVDDAPRGAHLGSWHRAVSFLCSIAHASYSIVWWTGRSMTGYLWT